MALENEVPLVDQDGMPRPTYQMHSAVMENTVRDDLKVLVCVPVMCCHSFTRFIQLNHKQPLTCACQGVSPHWDLMDRMHRRGPNLIEDLDASLSDRER